MDEIRRLVRVILGPETDGATFIQVRCHCGFEGHGRASETWEEHWTLTFPQISPHWRSTDGWRKGRADALGMMFHGRTWKEVESRAIVFLNWYNSQNG